MLPNLHPTTWWIPGKNLIAQLCFGLLYWSYQMIQELETFFKWKHIDKALHSLPSPLRVKRDNLCIIFPIGLSLCLYLRTLHLQYLNQYHHAGNIFWIFEIVKKIMEPDVFFLPRPILQKMRRLETFQISLFNQSHED